MLNEEEKKFEDYIFNEYKHYLDDIVSNAFNEYELRIYNEDLSIDDLTDITGEIHQQLYSELYNFAYDVDKMLYDNNKDYDIHKDVPMTWAETMSYTIMERIPDSRHHSQVLHNYRSRYTPE